VALGLLRLCLFQPEFVITFDTSHVGAFPLTTSTMPHCGATDPHFSFKRLQVFSVSAHFPSLVLVSVFGHVIGAFPLTVLPLCHMLLPLCHIFYLSICFCSLSIPRSVCHCLQQTTMPPKKIVSGQSSAPMKSGRQRTLTNKQQQLRKSRYLLLTRY
jgi:hypothetical protein